MPANQYEIDPELTHKRAVKMLERHNDFQNKKDKKRIKLKKKYL
jgi:hypothetical protein